MRVPCSADFVFCVDVTGDMKPYLDRVREKILDIINIIETETERGYINIDTLRAKVVSFRDVAFEANPMEVSKFYLLHWRESVSEINSFSSYLNSLEAVGGGDPEESVLTAIAAAIKSDFADYEGVCKRQIIFVFSSAATKSLEMDVYCASNPDTFSNLPQTFEEFAEIWNCADGAQSKLDEKCRGMFLFVPDDYSYYDLCRLHTVDHLCAVGTQEFEDFDMEYVVRRTFR